MKTEREKYTEVKTTPLKWHRFLQFCGMPLLIIFQFYILVSMFAELAGLQNKALLHIFTPFLSYLEVDVFHLGTYFWTVFLVLMAAIVMLLLVILAWTGSFRWRRYARHSWNLYLILRVIVSAGILYGILSLGGNGELVSEFMQRFAADNRIPFLAAIKPNLLTFLLVCVFLIEAVNFVFNWVYFFKRRRLFGPKIKPIDPESWVCEQCGQINTGNFCNNCGKQRYVVIEERPQDMKPVEPETEADNTEEETEEPEEVKKPEKPQAQAVRSFVRWLNVDEDDETEATPEETLSAEMPEESVSEPEPEESPMPEVIPEEVPETAEPESTAEEAAEVIPETEESIAVPEGNTEIPEEPEEPKE